MNNACKFTASGGQIWLTVDFVDASELVIRVRDSGVGIAADEIGKVFTMFEQGDKSLERSATGLGIGLSLVKTLTELHGGTVEATSAGVGHGSEFTVRLPVARIAESAPAEPASLAATSLPPLRILVVDDNRDSADMLGTLLTFGGHKTSTANDGLSAIEAAEKFQPDVILMDIGLPGLNGYEAARRVRERLADKKPILVALTGWGQDADRRRSEEAGFDAHLVKPVDHQVLVRLLKELLHT